MIIHILHPQSDEILASLDNIGERVFWDDEHEQDVSGLNLFRFKSPSTIPESSHIEGRVRMLIPAERVGWQEFVAYEVSTYDDYKEPFTIGAEIELNKLKNIIPAKHSGFTLKQYVNLATADTEYQTGNIEYDGIKTLTFDEHLGAYDFLHRVAQSFDVEIVFRVEVKGNQIIGRYIDMVERMGAYEGKEIEHGKDLIGIERRNYSERIVTALLCIGPEREDGTRLITTVTNEDAFQRWNRKGKHLLGRYEPETDDENMTLERLTQLGEAELKKRIDSVDEYIVTAATIESVYPNEKVRLGDSVRIKNTEYQPPLYAEARILSVKRSLTDPSRKSFIVGNVVTYKEEDVLKTYRQLQAKYGAKIIRSDTEPPGRPNTQWIDTSGPLDVGYTYNTQTQEWDKHSPTDASEINGLVVGQQYNGVSISPEDGFVVNRTDGLVENVSNATEGSYIQTRPTETDAFKKVWFVDEFGNLMFGGIARGAQIYIGGFENEDGVLVISGADNIPVGEINAATDTYNFPSLSVGDLYAPNVVPYADYRNETRIICVASEATAGISEPSDDNTGESWSSPLRTVFEALRRVPLSFKGTVEIYLAYSQTFDEDIEVSGFSGGGTLIIKNSADTTRSKVSGSVRIISNENFIEWRDVNLDSTDPYAGFFIRGSDGVINGANINGASGETTNAINVNSGSNFEIYNANHSNCTTAVRASYGGHAHVYNNTGSVSGVAMVAFGGTITGSGTAPTGAGGDISEMQGGRAPGSWSFPTPPPSPAPIAVTTKQTWSANSDSGTYRADFGGNWDTGSNYGNSVTQGKWDVYGPFTGAWFFGSALSTAVSGKTIKSIRVYAGRVAGGSGSSVNVKFRPHTSNTRPGGNVSLQTPEYSVGFKPGESKWITLPTSFHAGFASGSYKGIGIYSGSTSYAKMLKGAKIEITYQ